MNRAVKASQNKLGKKAEADHERKMQVALNDSKRASKDADDKKKRSIKASKKAEMMRSRLPSMKHIRS